MDRRKFLYVSGAAGGVFRVDRSVGAGLGMAYVKSVLKVLKGR
jgi:hypothetical protein